MTPPSPSPTPTTTSANLLCPRQNPQQPQLCPSPTTAWGPLGPTPTTTYLPCRDSQPTKPSCSGLSKSSVVALTVTIPLVLTCVAFIACAAAYYWGTKSNYNSGHDDGKAKGRREVEREVERRREEQEREREREKMWEDWRRRRGAEAVARNAAAANNGRATNNSAAARNAFHTNYRADKPVRGRTDSSSRPQPEGRTPRDRYWTTPLQYHPTTASQAPMINNQRKTPTWSAQPPLSRRSASTSQSQNLKPSRNAVPLSLASRHGRGTSRGPSRKTRVASAHRAEQARASTATERFENAATRPFPQNQRFEPAEPRRGSSSRPEHIRAESAGEAARGQVAARRRDGSVDGAEEWGGERRREGLEEAVLGDGVDGAAGDVNGGLRRASPAEGDGAPSPSLRRRSASLWGERSVARSESSASAAGSEEKAQDEEERASGDLDEGRWPHSDVERNKVEKSAWSRSSSPWGEPLSPRGEPRSPGNDGNTTAGSGETAQDKEDQEVGLAEEGHWPGSKWEGDEEGRSSRSRSPSPLDSPRTKSQSGGSDHSAADNGERGQNKEERATGVADEARWPDPERERDRDEEWRSPRSRSSSPREELRSKSPSPERDRAAAAGRGERGQDEVEREVGFPDEGRWPGSQADRDRDEGERSRSPIPGKGIRDV